MGELNMIGGGSGRWSGPGRVYSMAYTDGGENFYKIGYTARDPNERLREVQRGENNYNICLVGSVKANEMRGAETAAQQAAIGIGLAKDPNRGGATDWFTGPATQQQVLDAVRPAVYYHNARNKNP